MVRSNAQVWEFWTRLDVNHVKCNFCGSSQLRHSTRCQRHLCKCVKAPVDVRKHFQSQNSDISRPSVLSRSSISEPVDDVDVLEDNANSSHSINPTVVDKCNMILEDPVPKPSPPKKREPPEHHFDTSFGSRGTNTYWMKWNSQPNHISKQLRKLYLGDHLMSLTDVTLCSSDGQLIQAHKLVLSLCSPFFQKLFVQACSDKSPIVVLGNVKHSHLTSLLQFIYTGEVDVSAADLNSFLEVCEMLQIDGLGGCKNLMSTAKRATKDEDSSSDSEGSNIQITKSYSVKPQPRRKRLKTKSELKSDKTQDHLSTDSDSSFKPKKVCKPLDVQEKEFIKKVIKNGVTKVGDIILAMKDNYMAEPDKMVITNFVANYKRRNMVSVGVQSDNDSGDEDDELNKNLKDNPQFSEKTFASTSSSSAINRYPPPFSEKCSAMTFDDL